MIRTRNTEWGVCFYWTSFEEAFNNWFAGEVLEIFFEGAWLMWDDSNRILLRKGEDDVKARHNVFLQ